MLYLASGRIQKPVVYFDYRIDLHQGNVIDNRVLYFELLILVDTLGNLHHFWIRQEIKLKIKSVFKFQLPAII